MPSRVLKKKKVIADFTRMGETNLSFKFSAVLRRNSVEWADRRRKRKEGRQACCFSAAHLQKSTASLDQKSWAPQIVPRAHHKWHTDTILRN